MIEDIYFEFADCFCQQLLRQRRLYPESAFERRFKYGTHVFECTHPEVRAYLGRVLANARQVFQRGLLEGLALCTYGGDGAPLDRTVLGLAAVGSVVDAGAAHLLEEELRATLIKNCFATPELRALDESASHAL